VPGYFELTRPPETKDLPDLQRERLDRRRLDLSLPRVAYTRRLRVESGFDSILPFSSRNVVGPKVAISGSFAGSCRSSASRPRPGLDRQARCEADAAWRRVRASEPQRIIRPSRAIGRASQRVFFVVPPRHGKQPVARKPVRLDESNRISRIPGPTDVVPLAVDSDARPELIRHALGQGDLDRRVVQPAPRVVGLLVHPAAVGIDPPPAAERLARRRGPEPVDVDQCPVLVVGPV